MESALFDFELRDGFDEGQRAKAVSLFWEAFGGKLHRVMNPEYKALQFIASVADPTNAISAVASDGTLIGLAGFKTAEGAFIGGELPDLRAAYGWFGGLWRGLVLSLLERPVEPDTLLMDGIMVSEESRGQGVGSALLEAIKETATRKGYKQVRLDVIDTNPRARQLYERHGFMATKTESLGPLRRVFGFNTATTMVHTQAASIS